MKSGKCHIKSVSNIIKLFLIYKKYEKMFLNLRTFVCVF